MSGNFDINGNLKTKVDDTTPINVTPTPVTNNDFFLETAEGNVVDHSPITKFGYNSDIDTGSTPEDIWNQGGLYVAPTTARVHDIVSTSVNDTSAGTGARTVFIIGIDGSYNRVTETITLNGTSNVPTVNSYLHIHLMQVTSVGTTEVNQGVITATAQTDGTVTCSISTGDGQSASTIYLVPVGYRAFIMRIRARMNNPTANSAAEISVFTKPFGMGYQLKTRIGLNNSGNSFVELDYTGSSPYIVPEKSWLRLRCTSVTNNNTIIEGEYDLIVIKE